MLLKLSLTLLFSNLVFAASRTTPPRNATIIRLGTTRTGEYPSFADAIATLQDGVPATFFVYPGTYKEQVLLEHNAPVTIYGYTHKSHDYSHNKVTISAGETSGTAGGNDQSGTLRVHQSDFALYNVNVENSFGRAGGNGQAGALSQNGNRTAFYGCTFYGYQDTIFLEGGSAAFLNGFIEGATDFIYGGTSAYFQNNTLSIVGNGFVTASGRATDDPTMYVFESSTIVANGSYTPFLGRPWRDHARVIFKNTRVQDMKLNDGLWASWGDNPTANVFYADYNTEGNYTRPAWTHQLDKATAATFNISTTLGSNYTRWVDKHYL